MVADKGFKCGESYFSYMRNGEERKTAYISNGKVFLNSQQIATFKIDVDDVRQITTKKDTSLVGRIVSEAVAAFESSFLSLTE